MIFSLAFELTAKLPPIDALVDVFGSDVTSSTFFLKCKDKSTCILALLAIIHSFTVFSTRFHSSLSYMSDMAWLSFASLEYCALASPRTHSIVFSLF